MNNMGKSIINFFKGILFGIAVVIPGLSGSAFLVVLGIYEDVINAVANIRRKFMRNFLFLLPIALGGCLGIICSTRFVLMLCMRFRLPAYLLFIVLVLSAFPDVIKKVKKRRFTFRMLLLVFIGIVFIIAVGFFSQWLQAGHATEIGEYVAVKNVSSVYDGIVVLFSGLLSCGLMAVPGVSGSVILMMIGQYGTVYNAVATFNFPIIGLFALGAGVGIMCASKILSRILAKFEYEMYYVVMGILAGCIITLFVSGVLDIQYMEILGAIGLCT